MSYSAEWLVPLRIAEMRVWGEVTLDDMKQHTAVCVQMLTEAQTQFPHRQIHMIFDASGCTAFPPIYLWMPHGLPVLRFQNRGLMLLITNNKRIRSITEVTAHVMNFQMRTYPQREDALKAVEALLSHDERLTIRNTNIEG